MNDLKMGFKQTMLHRLQQIDKYPLNPTITTATITTRSSLMCATEQLAATATAAPTTPISPASISPAASGPVQVTDFSINRILGDAKPTKPPRRSPAQNLKTATPTAVLSPAVILDLSKTAVLPAAEPSSPTHPPLNYASSMSPCYGLNPDFIAAAAAANASKLYAHFFPYIFPTYNAHAANLNGNQAAPYQKRYFAPYILNSNGATTTAARPCNPAPPPQPTAQTAPLAPALTSAIATTATALPTAAAGARVTCPRTDCTGCLDFYKQFPYKAPRFAPTSPASSCTTSSGYSSNKSKGSPEVLLNSSKIALTTVTNLHFTTKPQQQMHPFVNSTTTANNFSTSSSLGPVNAEEISYKCRICDKVFGCSQTLQAHEKTHKSPRYECADCGKGFSQLRNYKYHLSVHRGTKEFAAECPECGKTFNDKGYLSSHMKIHRNKKEYECPYCPKSFNQRVAFNMHVRIHTGVKPHKCTECGKRFSRKMLLKQHMRTHSGEKPYQCSVCGKSFADRSNMTLHHRLHSGIKPFSCPICPKAFTKKHHLKTHLNYHTGCKPYICPHPNCNQAFTQSSNMRTHAKKCQYRPLQLSYPVASTTITATGNANNLLATPATSACLPRLALPAGAAPPHMTHAMPSSLQAGIRMLTATSSVTTAMHTSPPPPAQQPLLTTLRPF